MSEVFSLYKRGFIECGPSRGCTETVFLYECRDDISVHLKSCCLSRSNLKDYVVILQRAGLDGTSLDEVCARHRYGLGKYWRASRSCQYPRHGGSSKKAKGRDVINVTMAKEIYQLFGIHVSIVSRKKCLILISYLYKMRFLF